MIFLSRFSVEYDKRLHWVSFLGLAAPVAPHVADPLPTKNNKNAEPVQSRKKIPQITRKGKHRIGVVGKAHYQRRLSHLSQSLQISRLSSETLRHYRHRQHSPVSSHTCAAELPWPLELATR